MINKCLKLFILIIGCFTICGCSNIKVNKDLQKSKEEIIEFVSSDINSKYENINIDFIKEEDAYTSEKKLIKNGKYYYFQLKDEDGNIAYASYRDAFSIGKENYNYDYIESYSSIYDNKELNQYIHLADMYIDEKFVSNKYFAADYEDIDLYSKVKIVYELNYKLEDMSIEEYYNFMKLGYDLRKYKISKYGIIDYDDPEVCFKFKDENKYYYASYYGLADLNNNYYKLDNNKIKNYDDLLNISSYINFTVEDEEYNKMIMDMNNIGKYVINNVTNINVKQDDKYAYVLVENYTKNIYLMNLVFKFKYDINTSSYIYESMNIVDTNKVNDFDGVIVNSWKNEG